MAARKLTVVIAQSPGKNPLKRQLEEEIAAQLMIEGVADVSLVPHLNDLTADHSGALWLKSIRGDVVILAWLYPRGTHWILDRLGIKGRTGTVLLRSGDEDEEEAATGDEEPGGIGALNVPDRSIFALDLRIEVKPEVFLSEVRRIARETSVEVQPLALTGLGLGSGSGLPIVTAPTATQETPVSHAGDVRRRWFPVIDYSRCTNCMECIDFCLFGVYGLDEHERILVEQQDNCKKGCPACSRVCPANAIIFPEHKTPAIAGAQVASAGDFKIDLSKLFGAPSALELAVMERDTELVADGRAAVGMAVGIPKRQPAMGTKPKDALDDLIDGLDAI